MKTLAVEFLVPGEAEGLLSVLDSPLSLWGGFDVETGTVADVNHPQRSLRLAGSILAMREARGSSSSASALVEAARRGTAPCAIVLARPDPILIIGALIAFDLYQIAIPIILLPATSWQELKNGSAARTSGESSSLTVG